MWQRAALGASLEILTSHPMNIRLLFASLICFSSMAVAADPAPVVSNLDAQPLAALARRIFEATDFLGDPFSDDKKKAFAEALASKEDASEKIQAVLDERVLLVVTINPEMRVKVAPGPAKRQLIQNGWSNFLVKIVNEAGVTPPLNVKSPQAARVFAGEGHKPVDTDRLPQNERWLDLDFFTRQPMQAKLSGLGADYMLINLYSRDAGKRDARFSFDIGQGTQDLGFRSDCDILFDCLPAREITLRVKDDKGQPCMAGFMIYDKAGRVYPAQAKRLAPDFWFHPQVYREDGESVQLPDGNYTVEFRRGPESLTETRQITVNPELKELSFQVKRWIDPAAFGWISGDHHIHAAGCRHYSNPSEGVHATDMARHCRGEDLRIGANLTWGPCFEYQRQFFTGKEDVNSRWPYLLRYDVEVSGFGSHVSGHLCLLGLKEQIYPGENKDAGWNTHWPTLGLNTLKWAKQQGAVCGPAHSGSGLGVAETLIPNYAIPPMDGIGANEAIVDVTHELPGPDGKLVPALDFMSTIDTSPVSELNFWYHVLNAGYRLKVSGETDFPCVYGERVGMGRSYVKLKGQYTYDDWVRGVGDGRAYVTDGRSHFIDFKVNGVAPGEALKQGEPLSEVRVKGKTTLEITAKVAALLSETPETPPLIGYLSPQTPPATLTSWHLERARIGATRDVPVELVVNGQPVARQIIKADGGLHDVNFKLTVERSSWVALRILPSSHTNAVFVIADEKPIRASKRSIEWCLKSVDKCWEQKEKSYAEAEKQDAVAAYEHARQAYRSRLAETEVD